MKPSFFLSGAILLALSVSAAAPATPAAHDFRRGFAHVAQQATPAVVFIQVEKKIAMGRGGQFFFNDPRELFGEDFFERFFGRGLQRPPQSPPRNDPGRSFVQTGQGSGFIITKDGYILTNTHVVGDADRIMVRLQNGREYTAKRIGADARTEVAVIKIEAEDLPVARLGDATKLETGEWVVAIGNPFGLKETLTVGVVSAKGRTGIGITDYKDFIQTDAAINPGNSGGPLLNIDGEVVGINTAIFSRSGGYMGIGFAVPIDMAIGIKDQLVAHGRVTRGYLGVLLNPGNLEPEMAKSFGLREGGGVLVADVMPDTPAAAAGLKAGDIIVELQGAPVGETALFRQEIAKCEPGRKISLTIFRDGKRRNVTVTVGTAPDDNAVGAADSGASDGIAAKLGLELQPLTPDLATRLGYENAKGALVAGVAEGSPASRQGVQEDDLIESVNRQSIATPADFARQAGDGKGPLLLQLRTPRGRRFILLHADDTE